MAPYMLTNGMLAYALNLSVYNVIQVTSAVTFGVLGQAKDWLNVCVGTIVIIVQLVHSVYAPRDMRMHSHSVYAFVPG
jgi:hypothetical protein